MARGANSRAAAACRSCGMAEVRVLLPSLAHVPAPLPVNTDVRPELSRQLKKQTEVAHGGNGRVIEGIGNKIGAK